MRPLVHKAWAYPLHLFVAFLGINQFRLVGLKSVYWIYVGNTQRLSETCFIKKPGIVPAIPGLQETDLSLGAQWLSGRALDSRPKGRGFEPHRRHCVVSLSKTHLS